MAEIRHANLLKEIKENHARKTEFDGRLAEIAGGKIQRTQGSANGYNGADEISRRTTESTSRALLGSDQQRVRDDRSDEHKPESNSTDTEKTRRTPELNPEQQAQEEERKKELQRARQRRYEERKKQEKEIASETTAISDNFELKSASERHSHSQIGPDAGKQRKGFFSDAAKKDDVEIKAKQPAKDYSDVKLITIAEAVEAREKLIDLYIRGSSFIDKALQIVVKGHEEVHIWELSEFEAGMLADMQLEKAKKDKEAAALVHRLVEIHEKIFIFTLASGRLVGSGIHIAKSGGLGFR